MLGKLSIFFVLLTTITACSDISATQSEIVNPGTGAFRMPLNVKFYNEIARVNYSYFGCFGRDKFDLVIFEKSGLHYAAIESGENRTIEVRVSQAQLDSFDVFFRDLKYLSGKGDCTTSKYFLASYKNDTIQKSVADCFWNGFDRLQSILFPYVYAPIE